MVLSIGRGLRPVLSTRRCSPLLLVLLILPGSSCAFDGGRDDPGSAARALGEHLESGWKDRPEWGEMAVAILKGEAMDPRKGWWKPGAKLYGFDWLRGRADLSGDGLIQKTEWTGPAADFERLDRDQDGEISPGDLDRSPGQEGGSAAGLVFQRLDQNSNGRISQEEISRFFEKADRGSQGFVSREDLEEALAEEVRGPRSGGGGGFEPPPWMLLSMLFSGEIGCLTEGPRPGMPAPEIDLKTEDGKSSHKLSESRGKRPVVLIFGSFT